VIASRCEEDLRLVFEAAERLRVDDAIAVDLVGGAVWIGRFWKIAVGRFTRPRGEARQQLLAPLEPFSDERVGATFPVEWRRRQRSAGV
jgi:hypothetical protein